MAVSLAAGNSGYPVGRSGYMAVVLSCQGFVSFEQGQYSKSHWDTVQFSVYDFLVECNDKQMMSEPISFICGRCLEMGAILCHL